MQVRRIEPGSNRFHRAPRGETLTRAVVLSVASRVMPVHEAHIAPVLSFERAEKALLEE